MRNKSLFITILSACLLMLALAPVAAQDDDPGVLNIYSSRHYGALEAPFVAFQEDTGIEVRVSQGSPRDLLARLQADIDTGGRSVADVFLAIDAGVLDIATDNGLLQPIDSDVLTANIPETDRDPDNHWFGLSKRARTLVYNTANVTQDEIDSINTYADLADPQWEGRFCMRPASHIYTVSLTSGILFHQGEEAALEIVDGWTNNVVRYINSDTSQINAVGAGECDFAIVNHYYVGRLIDTEDPVMDVVELKWLNQGEDDFGVFYNINGAGVVVNAANFDNAVTFIEYMSSVEAQAGTPEGFPGSNYEFPTNPDAEVNEIIAGFGEVRFDTEYALWNYGDFQADAVTLLEDAGFGFDEN